MEVMFDRVAGLDVGKETVAVCLRIPGSKGRRHAETRTFKTMLGSLRVMRDWLVETGVIAAMESTSTRTVPRRDSCALPKRDPVLHTRD